ncbi:MAG: hypothetical protein HQ592_00630 [Planctomycetes bacterium]|nr:hypothetical protein [Planctomycetota bacterium]
MIHLAKEPIRVLNEKLRSLEKDVSELTKMTAAAAGETLGTVAAEMKKQCEKTSVAAKEFVVENPGTATLAAGAAGFAIGYLVHLIRRRP